MPKHFFTTSNELLNRINAYFNYIEGEYYLENKSATHSKAQADSKQKIWMREPEPATLTGLAIFLGFHSRQAFEKYEENGRFANVLKSGRLRVEAIYEKKLHLLSSASGAIFALKSMGWNEKTESKTIAKAVIKNIKIEIIETGPKPADNEKEVIL
jgi:hypothetical protein